MKELDNTILLRIQNLREIAFDAMLSSYMYARNPHPKIVPDWKRSVREKYEGTVYAEAVPEIAHAPKLFIDPHAWAGMKQGVYGAIENAVTYEHLDPHYIEGYIDALAEEAQKKPDRRFKREIMIIGLKAAQEAITNEKNDVKVSKGAQI